MQTGNVVKWKHKPDLYIVSGVDYDFSKKRCNNITMIPFDGCNCSTHVSREHPFMTNVVLCGCGWDCDCDSPVKRVPNRELSIDNVVYVAKDVHSFIMGRIKNMMGLE